MATARTTSIAMLAFGLALLASCRGAAPAPAVGAPAPDFHLQDQQGAWHSLPEYRGHWLVLYFYPKDETPGCTAEACELRDNIFAFRRLDAAVVGISVDNVDAHRAFAAKYSLPFTLLADSDKRTAADYGVLVRMLGVFELARRDTFLIDPQGRIARHWAQVDPKANSALVLSELGARQPRLPPPH